LRQVRQNQTCQTSKTSKTRKTSKTNKTSKTSQTSKTSRTSKILTSYKVRQSQENIVPIGNGHLLSDPNPSLFEKFENFFPNFLESVSVFGPVRGKVVGE
jgi:hypothetical protein